MPQGGGSCFLPCKSAVRGGFACWIRRGLFKFLVQNEYFARGILPKWLQKGPPWRCPDSRLGVQTSKFTRVFDQMGLPGVSCKQIWLHFYSVHIAWTAPTTTHTAPHTSGKPWGGHLQKNTCKFACLDPHPAIGTPPGVPLLATILEGCLVRNAHFEPKT